MQTNRWNNSGSGVIIAKSNPHLRIVNTSIINNNCSGLVAIGSNIIFNGAVNISNNNVSSGGGLVLCSRAILYFNVSTELTIADNRAKHVGGGILVEYNCRQAKPICFFQHLPHNRTDSVQPTVNMTGNRANYIPETTSTEDPSTASSYSKNLTPIQLKAPVSSTNCFTWTI